MSEWLPDLGVQPSLRSLAALPASMAFWLVGSAMEMTKEMSKDALLVKGLFGLMSLKNVALFIQVYC